MPSKGGLANVDVASVVIAHRAVPALVKARSLTSPVTPGSFHHPIHSRAFVSSQNTDTGTFPATVMLTNPVAKAAGTELSCAIVIFVAVS